jgi:hypothetical protein
MFSTVYGVKLVLFLAFVSTLYGAVFDSAASLLADNALERITISALLMSAVAFLWRELREERKKSTARQESLMVFVGYQSELMTTAAKGQTEALAKVVSALNQLETASREQSGTYQKHIERMLERAQDR